MRRINQPFCTKFITVVDGVCQLAHRPGSIIRRPYCGESKHTIRDQTIDLSTNQILRNLSHQFLILEHTYFRHNMSLLVQIVTPQRTQPSRAVLPDIVRSWHSHWRGIPDKLAHAHSVVPTGDAERVGCWKMADCAFHSRVKQEVRIVHFAKLHSMCFSVHG